MKKETHMTTYSANNLPKASAKDKAALRAAMKKRANYSDAPKASRRELKNATLVFPQSDGERLRIEPKLYRWFKHFGKNKDARINAALRSYMNEHSD